MNIKETIEKSDAEFGKILICPDTNCDSMGTSCFEGRDGPEPMPCQYCFEVILPAKNFLHKRDTAILEAYKEELRGEIEKIQNLNDSSDMMYQGGVFDTCTKVLALIN